jgi:hypothetical protein
LLVALRRHRVWRREPQQKESSLLSGMYPHAAPLTIMLRPTLPRLKYRYKSFLKIALEDQRVQNAIINALMDAMEEEQANRENLGSPDASA